jgi:hypothetical protein
MAVAEIDDADARSQIEELYTLVGGDEGSFAIFKDMLAESSNAFSNVLLTKSGCIEGTANSRHSRVEATER